MPQSHTTEQPTASRGRDTEHRHSRTQSKASNSLFFSQTKHRTPTKTMNQQQQNHRLQTDSSLSHQGIKTDILLNMFKPSSDFLLTAPRRCFFCGSFLLVMFHVCLGYAVLSVIRSLVFTYWERADLLARKCVVFSCISSLSQMS